MIFAEHVFCSVLADCNPNITKKLVKKVIDLLDVSLVLKHLPELTKAHDDHPALLGHMNNIIDCLKDLYNFFGCIDNHSVETCIEDYIANDPLGVLIRILQCFNNIENKEYHDIFVAARKDITRPLSERLFTYSLTDALIVDARNYKLSAHIFQSLEPDKNSIIYHEQWRMVATPVEGTVLTFIIKAIGGIVSHLTGFVALLDPPGPHCCGVSTQETDTDNVNSFDTAIVQTDVENMYTDLNVETIGVNFPTLTGKYNDAWQEAKKWNKGCLPSKHNYLYNLIAGQNLSKLKEGLGSCDCKSTLVPEIMGDEPFGLHLIEVSDCVSKNKTSPILESFVVKMEDNDRLTLSSSITSNWVNPLKFGPHSVAGQRLKALNLKQDLYGKTLQCITGKLRDKR